MISIPCDIVLLPSTDLARRAIDASQSLRRFDTLFTLGEDRFVPHISLYMTQLKIADLKKVKEFLNDIACETPKIRLGAEKYDQAEGFIDLEYRLPDELGNLQMTVIEAIDPIRDGMRAKDRARLDTATGKVRENLEKYGYRGVGELFRPHLSLTRFADKQSIDTASLPKANEFSGQFTRLGLFEMGDNGTCAKRLAEFELKDSE